MLSSPAHSMMTVLVSLKITGAHVLVCGPSMKRRFIMDWRYRANPTWLDARKQVLTATDFVELKPSLAKASKAALNGDKLLPMFTSVWMEKHGDPPITEDDLWSYGAQARGHILEPHAVDLYGKYTKQKFKHWDDVVVCNDTIGFSPDAVLGMDCPEPGAFPLEDFNATEILEVKCYGLENHGKMLATASTAMKERFQIAWAMHCCPSIEKGTLLFYNPSAPIPMFTEEFRRQDLEEELQMAEQVERIYRKSDEQLRSHSTSEIARFCRDKGKDELQIWAEATQSE